MVNLLCTDRGYHWMLAANRVSPDKPIRLCTETERELVEHLAHRGQAECPTPGDHR
jgi:hypothetical protein